MKVLTQGHRSTKTLRYSHKTVEHCPSSHTWPPHQQGSSVITVGYSWKSSKTQALFKKELLGKPKANRGDKNKDTKGNWSLLKPTATANIKSRKTSSQIYIKPHTKGLFTSVSITQFMISSFQPKFTRHAKRSPLPANTQPTSLWFLPSKYTL